jgi:hypothetical protein
VRFLQFFVLLGWGGEIAFFFLFVIFSVVDFVWNFWVGYFSLLNKEFRGCCLDF